MQWVETSRILGVTPDKQFTWSPLIDQGREKIAQSLGMMGPLLSRRSDLPFSNGVVLYKQLLRPMTD